MAALVEARSSDPRWWAERSVRVVVCAFLGLALAAWVAMLTMPTMGMPGMSGAMSSMAPPGATPAHPVQMSASSAGIWSWADCFSFTAGWGLMMAAMMLPTATPMIALHATVARRRGSRSPGAQSATFAAPYAALWTLSAIPVYAAATGIHALVSSHEWARQAGPYAVATSLLVAGIYQFTPLKRACLTNCRHPLNFLATRWRPGLTGAARMGFAHATYCVGCCGLLMVILVAAGAMGLAWVLLVAGVVALEKLALRWSSSPTWAGIALMALGMAVFLHPSLATQLRS